MRDVKKVEANAESFHIFHEDAYLLTMVPVGPIPRRNTLFVPENSHTHEEKYVTTLYLLRLIM